jgi:hypothetical protein
MKIRNGFVSNSSSSSFIVSFPREPKSVEDVKNALFSNGTEYFYSPYGDNKYTVQQVSETVWQDICGQTKNNMTAAAEELSYGSIDDYDAPDYDDFRHIKDNNERREAYDIAKEIYVKKKMKDFFNTRKNKLKKIDGKEFDEVVYIFEYSDNDGDYFNALEHGGLFDNLKHIRISKH